MRKLVIGYIIFSLTGCAAVPHVKLDHQLLESELRSASIEVVVFEEKPIRVFTPGDAVGGGLIDALTKPDGSRIALPSPSYLLGVSLREQLKGLNIENVPNQFSRKPAKGEAYPFPEKYSLSVEVNVNFLGYRPLDWATYQYMIGGAGTLRDPSGEIVWQNQCKVGGTSGDETLQLHSTEFRGEGTKLINIMELAAERCAKQLALDFQPGGIR